MDESHPVSDVSPHQKSSTPVWIVAGVGVVLIFAWVLFLRPHIELKQVMDRPGVGQPLPALQLQPLTGTTDAVTLQSLRGKVALINYWGPWCGFCIEEFPHLVELWDTNRGNPDFAFVSVSSSGHSQEDIAELRDQTEKFLRAREATFPTYVDPNGENRQLLESVIESPQFGYPTTVLLDRNGIIRALWTGYVPGYDKQMSQLVSQLLTEKPADKPTR